MINTFTIDPDQAEELLEAPSETTIYRMSRRQRFVSANLHVSTHRKHVMNYVQWQTREDNDAMLSHPAMREHLQKASGIATSFDPIYYALSKSHEASAG